MCLVWTGTNTHFLFDHSCTLNITAGYMIITYIFIISVQHRHTVLTYTNTETCVFHNWQLNAYRTRTRTRIHQTIKKPHVDLEE